MRIHQLVALTRHVSVDCSWSMCCPCQIPSAVSRVAPQRPRKGHATTASLAVARVQAASTSFTGPQTSPQILLGLVIDSAVRLEGIHDQRT